VSVSSFPSSGDRPANSSRERELRLELEIQRARMTNAREEFEREEERRLWQQQQPQSRPTDVHASVALPRMANDNDVLTFFNTFERLLQMHNVDKSQWSMRLFPQITSKAQKPLRRLSTEECKGYDKVKRSILSYFKLDANSYLTAFRKERRTGNETYRMWANRLFQCHYRYHRHCLRLYLICKRRFANWIFFGERY